MLDIFSKLAIVSNVNRPLTRRARQRAALQNAASVASLLLTTEALIAEKPEKKAGAGATPDMGDMGM